MTSTPPPPGRRPKWSLLTEAIWTQIRMLIKISN